MSETLPHEDLLRVRAAEGWLELGLQPDAAAELAQIAPGQQDHPLVLILSWRVQAEVHDWERCAAIGEKLVCVQPTESFGWIHRSYALHELRRTRQAAELLAPALTMFPEEEIIPYNLACYACQLGDFDEAKALLETSMTRGDRQHIRLRALSDPDLEPLKAYIAEL